MTLSAEFLCPECRGDLTPDAGGAALACGGCGRAWPVIAGVPDFTGADIYWGEFERPIAEQLVATARESGWRAAAETTLAPRPELIDYILNERRANALGLVPFARRGRLLDIGAGWGAITTAASRLFDEVYSIEAVRLRAQFTRLRLDGEGRPNVALAQASLFALPFRENFFDVILLNGILEWIGDWNPALPPRAAQRELLQSLSKFLRPGGLLLVGIENRIGFRYLLGRRDHNNLWGTNFLPRPLANLAQKMIQGSPYRVYTYSMPGLRRLLRDGGFARTEFFAPIPGYNVPTTIVPLKRLEYHLTRRISRHTLGRRLAAMAAVWLDSLGVLRHIPADFLAVAQNPGGAADEPMTIWDEVRAAPGMKWPDAVRSAAAADVIIHGEHNPGRPVMIVLDKLGRQPVAYVKTAAPQFAPVLRTEQATLEALASRHEKDASRIAPRPYGLVESPRGCALAMEAIDGETLHQRWSAWAGGLGADELLAVDAAVLELALTLGDRVSAGDPPADTNPIRESWRAALREIEDLLPVAALKSLSEKMAAVSTLRFQHGDFFSKNIVVREKASMESKYHLVDWADAGHHWPPLFDVVLFLLTCRNGEPAARRAAHARADFLGEGALAPFWRDAWTRGQSIWKLPDNWTPVEAALLSLAVYRRRIAGLKGAAHPEVKILDDCLRALSASGNHQG